MIWIAIALASVSAGWVFGHGDSASNARAAFDRAPTGVLTLTLGVTFGLYARGALRHRRGFSSPTLAYGGKLVFFASMSAAASWTLSPLAWPPESLHVCCAGGALGAGLWIGNLPTRL